MKVEVAENADEGEGEGAAEGDKEDRFHYEIIIEKA